MSCYCVCPHTTRVSSGEKLVKNKLFKQLLLTWRETSPCICKCLIDAVAISQVTLPWIQDFSVLNWEML